MATNKVTVIMANEKDGVLASRKQFFCKLAITGNICYSCYSGADWALYSLAARLVSYPV